MSEWKLKRFWSQATVEKTDQGFAILLDGRSVKTPAKSNLIVPTEKMARAIAAEWDAQTEEVQPHTMPITRAANSAIDKVRVQFDEVTDLILAYGEADLLYYRADAPAQLVERQNEQWNPLVDWAKSRYGVTPVIGQGVMFVAQEPDILVKFEPVVKNMSEFQVAAFHDLVGISGSLILGLAVFDGFVSAETAWNLSRLDEDWQIEQWGQDDEAQEVAEQKYASMVNAHTFLQLCD